MQQKQSEYKLKFRELICFFALFLVLSEGFTQPTPPEQWPAEVRENYSLASDDLQNKNFKAAKAHIHLIITKYGGIHPKIYNDALKIYEGMSKTEAQPDKKMLYQDSVLTIYDLKIKYFGEEANTLNLKGYKATPYWQNRPEKAKELYDLMKKIVALNGKNTLNLNVSSYMYMVCQMKGKEPELTDEKIIDIHEELTEIIDHNLDRFQKENKAEYVDAWKKTQEYIDSQLEKCVDISCAFIQKQFYPKFKENSKDTLLLKKIYGLGVAEKCFSESYFLEVVEALVKNAPTCGRIKNYAVLLKNQGKTDAYIEQMLRALEMCGNNTEKADFYLELAEESAKKGNLNQARTYAYKAIEYDKSRAAKAYNLIGFLYFNSAGVCTTSDLLKAPVYNSVAYLAAYEMFEKAGNAAMMSSAKQYFPSAENIHQLGMTDQLGARIQVGCWIGGTATLRKK